MKKLFTFIALIVLLTINAQAPQGFNYQATVRNSSGALVINQNVNFKFNIMLNSATSLPVFSETHLAPTDDLGQVNLVIGQGSATVGSFSTINWGNGNYFLGIELNTGAGYVAMGTTQLLSVPYALYANSAGSTQSQGKTSIYLTGNITNAQAAAKIAAEFGPYTENIYIKNTTQLTSVDLSALVTISNIEIYNNSNLTSVNLNNLTTIEDEFRLESSAINSLSFTSLLNCSGLYISSGTLSSLNLPLLSSIDEFYFSLNYLENSSSITSLNFPSVQTIRGFFNLYTLNSLTSLTFPILNSLSGNININSNSSLTTIGFPALTSCTSFSCNPLVSPPIVSGSISILGSSDNTSINLSSLNTCNEIIIGTGANINISNLTSCQYISINGVNNFTPPSNLMSCNSLTIQNMPNLTSLSFPSLSSCDIFVQGNPLLNSVSFPALTNSSYLYLSNNALPTSKINSLLNKFLTVSPTVQKNIDLSNQNPLAPPTGQGLIDKQTLINTGNSVITD